MERRKRNIDWVSGLPDELLCHILSFLETKLSVQSSVLAKRWRFMWAHVPNLKFKGYDFRGKQPPLDIVNRVVMLHQAQTLNTFELYKVKPCSSDQLDSLIIHLLTNRTLRSLHLDFYMLEYGDNIAFTLPTRLLLTSKTLVDLELVNCGLIPSTGELLLPSLKKLSLVYVDYESDESLPHLLSGCPVLEELNLEVLFRNGQKNKGWVIVSSPTIKRLIVDFPELTVEKCPDEMLIMDVPALVYLTVVDCNLDSIKSLAKTMTSLVKAEINLIPHTCGTNCTGHIEFLSCLCCVRCLKISTDFDYTLIDIRSLPKFVDLTKLELDLTLDWCNVVKFLEVADNLEVLIITLYELPSYKEPKRVPPCMISRLRSVVMYNFSACEDAFDTVRYVSKNARVLERMEIDAESGFSDEEKLDAVQRISLFERGSASCHIALNRASVTWSIQGIPM